MSGYIGKGPRISILSGLGDAGSGAATDGQVLTADGAGGVAWEEKSPIDLLSSGASIRKSDGTTAVLSESGGAVTLENVANAYLSGGVYLGGSASANYLDDYEEGTWNPTISGSISNPTLTYATRVGHYTKFGRLVSISCAIQPNTTSVAGSGNLIITGLPFTVSSTVDIAATGVSQANGDFSWGAGKTSLVFNAARASTRIDVAAMENGVAEAGIPVGNFNTSSKYLYFSLTYMAA